MLSNPESLIELPLLKTKITIPPLPQDFVQRPRLVERIDQGVKGPLTLLSAPAGFGKTNLLVEWAAQNALAQSSPAIAWLTLNREDNDLVRFFRYLTSAIQEVNPKLGNETLDFIHTAKGSGLEMGLTLLVNEISSIPDDLVLVIDDFHVVEDASIYQGLTFFLQHVPQNMHLVVASRREPVLDLAYLRAKGWVTELGADELRFTGEEISQFFSQTVGLQLPPEMVLALEQRTEGWIAALKLAAISLRNQPDPLTLLAGFHGDAHYLVDFLSDEVLYRQPEDVRRFLLRSSILDALCGPLCEAVVDSTAQPGYGAAILDRLEHANLFLTPLDLQHEWFRYHPLFADFLRHVESETEPTEIPLLQQRAALWFERHANLDEAFRYALVSGDGEWAADLIERNTESLIKTGDLQLLTRWIGKLPAEVVHQHPYLSLTYAWGSIAVYQIDNARYWLEDVQRSIDRVEKQSTETKTREHVESDSLWNIHGGLAICRSTLALMSGDIQQAAEYSREAEQYLKEENPFIQSLLSLEDSMYFILSGDTTQAIEKLQETARIARLANNLLALVVANCQLAETLAMQGHLSQALATLQKAQFIALGPNGSPLPLAGIVDIEIGEILRERDLLEQAKEHLKRGIQLTQPWWSLSSLDGMISLACLLQSQGDMDGSQALIAQASQLALSTESSLWDDVITSAVAVRLALQRNDLAAATKAWEKGRMLKGVEQPYLTSYPYHIHEYLQINEARFNLAIGQDSGDTHKLQQASEILESILPNVERFKRVTSKIEILVLQALVKDALGDLDGAVAALLKALAQGEPEEYRRIFLDEGQPMAELLVTCWQVQQESHTYLPSLGYIEGLLGALPPVEKSMTRIPSFAGEQQSEGKNAKTEDGLPISLSARELQVLTLIADGKSNQEISAELYLALNTVKRHAYNIYTKLEVEKRTQAVSKARQLGFIP